MSTYRALEVIKKEIESGRQTVSVNKALRAAETALKMQIPQSPTIEGDGFDPEGNMIYDTWICPSCGEHYELESERYDHCPKCGQRILFPKEEEV